MSHVEKQAMKRRNNNSKYMRATPKIMTPTLLCLPMTSEADVDMAVEAQPFPQYSIPFCFHMTDGNRGALWHNGVRHGRAYEAKVPH